MKIALEPSIRVYSFRKDASNVASLLKLVAGDLRAPVRGFVLWALGDRPLP